ncbi:hypothetical protein PoB_005792400 [Plakobranchus ocellatus]|uniref:Integrase zinc-binding domain-containing protein n=1 Tax=Plakobranchus ocellatus TaxID=259542 RepID=A0AAV4CJU7_9GAST|nr:hypothetical protein PoB_005792400 [Plakobranchus ocellatus]
MRNEMLHILQFSRRNREKETKRARKHIYWPRINTDIEDYVKDALPVKHIATANRKNLCRQWNARPGCFHSQRSKHRNPAIQKHHAQLLFNRRLINNRPTLKINLKPAIPAKARQELEERQQKQKVLCDRHCLPSRTNKTSREETKVRVQLKDKWIEGRIYDKHQTRSYWINTDSDQAMYRHNICFIRHDKSPPAAPVPGSSDIYNPVHSDNDKMNPNSHFNKDKLTQSKHSGRPPSHDLLQSHS